MLAKRIRNSKVRHKMAQFNMTPMIDVVFLLIVFFMLICQFISQDDDLVSVPDDCETAVVDRVDKANEIEILVWAEEAGSAENVIYSVNNKDFPISKYGSREALTAELAEQISQLKSEMEEPVVRLRGDGSLSCVQVRPAIEAAGMAGLDMIRFGAFKEEESGSRK